MTDQKNTLLAIVLSAIVLIGWQLFFGAPQLARQKQIAEQQQQEQTKQPPGTQPATGTQPGVTPAPSAAPRPAQPSTVPSMTREAALALSPRVRIDTPLIGGSIALKGGRVDDISLLKFRETVDPNSPPIVLLAPSGSPQPFYSEFGWVAASGTTTKVPGNDTEWRQEGSSPLSIDRPVTLVYDNGEGLEFRRVISVDDKYLFTVKDTVANKTEAPVTLHPYALIARHGAPPTLGYYILHEGLIGVMGDQGLQELTYKKMDEAKGVTFEVTNAWLGITDKYWAAVLLPNTDAKVTAHFSAGSIDQTKTYQTDYLLAPITVAPGATGTANARLFAGAKEVSIVDGYNDALNLNKFDRLIDWGYFYFLTKPMFLSLDWIYRHVGNFGIAILLITVAVKILFFPLANKSYASMAKMKAVQPQLTAIRERYAEDKVKQQQAMMELYKKEKINPVAGCLPMIIQVPVFFSLYKVLFVTIEMRHAPFFGWIHDLSAPDPTNVFTLFGLIPWEPTTLPVVGSFMHLGAWALIMGVTMWAQMKLNPPPPDPTQQMIFNWMPVIFTFMLSNFPAGLVIYWAWNNSLSVAQQSIIMSRHGAKIELWDNLKSLFVRKKAQS